MKKILLAVMLLFAPLGAHADLNIFACEPEWAALAKELGGKLVKVNSATNALQDPHYIQARPSLISKVRKADLVICSGAQLEIGWLPMLLRKSNNASIMPGTPGYLEASQHVKRLHVQTNADRSKGDVHPMGNPHIQTNPHNIQQIAVVLTERMKQLDADNAETYTGRLQNFSQRWSNAITDWEKRALPLRGKKMITHHGSWAYLEDWLGLEQVATLEPVSGVPPTASHLSNLLSRFNGSHTASFIIRAPYQSDKASVWLSERSGIPALMLPLTVGGTHQAKDLFGMFDDILNQLLDAVGR